MARLACDASRRALLHSGRRPLTCHGPLTAHKGQLAFPPVSWELMGFLTMNNGHLKKKEKKERNKKAFLVKCRKRGPIDSTNIGIFERRKLHSLGIN